MTISEDITRILGKNVDSAHMTLARHIAKKLSEVYNGTSIVCSDQVTPESVVKTVQHYLGMMILQFSTGNEEVINFCNELQRHLDEFKKTLSREETAGTIRGDDIGDRNRAEAASSVQSNGGRGWGHADESVNEGLNREETAGAVRDSDVANQNHEEPISVEYLNSP